MTSVLEYFLSLSPEAVITRNFLEQYLPYAVVHSNNMDIALGKVRVGDKMDVSLFNSVASGGR